MKRKKDENLQGGGGPADCAGPLGDGGGFKISTDLALSGSHTPDPCKQGAADSRRFAQSAGPVVSIGVLGSFLEHLGSFLEHFGYIFEL